MGERTRRSYSNRIKTIENLGHLTELHTLWLMDNEIEVVQHMEGLQALQCLNMARNRIREISNSLDANTALIELNLAGNELWSFKDLLNLTRSANLRKLSFADPDYGDNPVCELCNYQVRTAQADGVRCQRMHACSRGVGGGGV
jgi:Leucine-rich repeat (LRR) protein